MIRRETQEPYIEVDGEVLPPDCDLGADFDEMSALDEGSFWEEYAGFPTEEYSYRGENLLINGQSLVPTEQLADNSVSLELAYEAMKKAAVMYGQRARARGLTIVAQDACIREQVNNRMYKDIDLVVSEVTGRSSYSLKEEVAVLAPAIGTDKLRDANGRLGADEEQLALSALVYIRSQIGVEVGHVAREAYLRQLGGYGAGSRDAA